MARDPGRPLRRVTVVLMALAYAGCEVAFHPDGNPRPFGVAFGLALAVLAVVVGYLVPAPPSADARPPRWGVALLVGLLAGPVLVEPVAREWTGDGLPMELRWVSGLRALGLGLAAFAAWPACRRLAGVVALFLALFTTAMGDQPQIPYVLAPLAVVGGLWLVLTYRADLYDQSGTTAASSTVVERVRLRVPAWELASSAALAGVVVALLAAGPTEVVAKLGEWVPSSGGTGDADPFARFGSNDGPEETKGMNANSAGMVDAEMMIEDQNDTLIDAANDMYGRPHRPRKNPDRMVAAGLLKVKENHDRLTQNRRPSRDFDTARKGPEDARRADGRNARGLFEVAGRTPLHVRVAAYDRYDFADRCWAEAARPTGTPFHKESTDPADDWMRVTLRRAADWYAEDDAHRLKVADPSDNLVPAPAMLTRLRIHRVNRTDDYEWDSPDVVALAGRRKTPPGVVVHTECRTLDPAELPANAFDPVGNPAPPRVVEVPPELAGGLRTLAVEWAGDRPRGWPQLDAVLRRLRDEYALDPKASAPADHPAPVLWFLTEGRRGPDYLFATSAALLLRSLGYPARVCAGFYASPSAYDPETEHTPVKATDLHLWPEVRLADGHWLVVEPTPGYEVLPAKRHWSEQVLGELKRFADVIRRHPLVAATLLLIAAAAVARRQSLADALRTLRWRLAPGRTWRDETFRSLRLLEWRMAQAGCPRPPSLPLAGWLGEVRGRVGPDDALDALVRLAEWAAYAPATTPPAADARAVCRHAVHTWTLRRLRRRGAATEGANR